MLAPSPHLQTNPASSPVCKISPSCCSGATTRLPASSEENTSNGSRSSSNKANGSRSSSDNANGSSDNANGSRAATTPMADARKEKLVVIMGSTGTGKSRLSVDIATKFPSEIINSDKMQVYKGLDIATNKIPDHERAGVPHHLMDFVEPSGDLGAGEYTELAAQVISAITARGRVPILVGGSNSYIQALVWPNLGPEFRYDCCFIWVDVDLKVLDPYLSRRVDEMMDAGLLTEMAEFYDPNESVQRGVRLSIGVPEFNRYFLHYPPDSLSESSSSSSSEEDWDLEEEKRKKMLGEVIDEMKLNTVKLAEKQKFRIQNFRASGWDIHRIDATSVFEAVPSEFGHVWENTVLNPALEIVKKFLSPKMAGVSPCR